MISLKAYNREIESLIENQKINESIAHCKRILSKYPKCIETYRLLGKSLLEQKKFTESSDIFSRVLTAYPDDFLSHVCLSIIAEEDRDLDLSIWHMESAFDVQPSNLAIQEELRRLFGRRDGVQPDKIRLSRGALIRMYVKGELYQQAIAEIHSALAENPKRIDLEVLLARMQYQSGSIVETVETCNNILEKLPFCYDPNLLLDLIFSKSGNLENAKIHRDRLISLNPFYEYQPPSLNALVDNEDSVMLEKLIYDPSIDESSSIPSWSENEKYSIDGTLSTEKIDWLPKNGDINNLNPNPAFISSEESLEFNTTDLISDEKNEIPEWMKNAGWEPSLQDSTNFEPSVFSNDETVPAEKNQSLPDWLSQIESGENDEQTITENSSMFLDNNLDQQNDLSSMKRSLNEWEKEETMGSNSDENNTQDWLSQFSKENSNSDDLPDWLKSFNENETSGKENEEIPEWLHNIESTSSNDQNNQSEIAEMPVNEEEISAEEKAQEIISGIKQSHLRSEEELSAEKRLEEELAFLLSQKENTSKPIEPSETTKFTSEFPVLDELTSLSNESDKFEDTEVINTDLPIPSSEEVSSLSDNEQIGAKNEEIPYWVKSILHPEQQIEAEQNTILDPNAQIPNEIPETTIPDETSEGVISQETNDELMEWLRGLKAEDEKAENNVAAEIDKDEFALQEESLEEISSFEDRILDFSADSNVSASQTDRVIDNLNQFESESSDTVPVTSTDDVNSLFAPEIEDKIAENISMQDKEEIQSNEFETQKFPESIQSNSVDLYNQLIDAQDFSNLPAVFSEMIKSGKNFDTLIEVLSSSISNQSTNFEYWQCLGDIYAQHDKLSEALSAYDMAESILTKKV